MAKKPQAKEESDGERPKPNRRRLIIFGAAGLAGLAALGGGVWATSLVGGGHHPAKPATAEPGPKRAHFVDLPDLTVNLSGADATPAYLRIKIALEVGDKAVADQIQPVMPRVLDAFQTYLRELRASDLSGSAGVYRLKEELRRRVNLAVHPAKVDAVLFKEILVQ